MTRKWNIPLTYEPKIQAVIDGKIRQTIRTGRKFSVGDLVRFYVWQGKPYRSNRATIIPYKTITDAVPIRVFPEGWDGKNMFHPWDSSLSNLLARWDGIVPPTGIELGYVLTKKNKIPVEGIEAQIIRWQP